MSLIWKVTDFADEERRERLEYQQDNFYPFVWFSVTCVLSAAAIGLGLYFYPITTAVLVGACVVGSLYLVGREFRE